MSPYTIGFCIGLTVAFVISVLWHVVKRGLDRYIPSEESLTAVDPWSLQHRLMEISNQKRPQLPEVNETSLLYWALMLEEMSETGNGLLRVLERAWPLHHVKPGEAPRVDLRASVRNSIYTVTLGMITQSKRVRKILEDLGRFEIKVTRDEAKELLDGTTDNAVVNSGFSIASGMPGAMSYLAVLKSNLSKANPATGLIDKTPDGKWIKGSEYREPDLDAVLDMHGMPDDRGHHLTQGDGSAHIDTSNMPA